MPSEHLRRAMHLQHLKFATVIKQRMSVMMIPATSVRKFHFQIICASCEESGEQKAANCV